MLNNVCTVLGSINGSLQIFNHIPDIDFPSIPDSLTTSVCANRASLSSTYVIPMECKVRMLNHLFAHSEKQQNSIEIAMYLPKTTMI